LAIILNIALQRKSICPKCGGNHDNCELKTLKCLNCKGSHFVLDKKCPFFLKEKEVRKIMSQEQVTYKKALQLLNDKKEKHQIYTNEVRGNKYNTSPVPADNTVTYSSVVTRALIHHQGSEVEEEMEEGQSTGDEITTEQQKKRRSNKKPLRKKKQSHSPTQNETKEKENSQYEKTDDRDEGLSYKFDLVKFWFKLKKVFMTHCNFNEKLLLVLKIIIEEIRKLIVGKFWEKELFENLLSFING
jgi:hypothetical protein